MTCCNRDCKQGDACPYADRAAALARALTGYALVIASLMGLAVWLASMLP